MKEAKRHAITRITERPRRRLEDIIELREKIMTKSDDIAERINELHTLLKDNEYDQETDEGLLETDMSTYLSNFVGIRQKM